MVCKKEQQVRLVQMLILRDLMLFLPLQLKNLMENFMENCPSSTSLDRKEEQMFKKTVNRLESMEQKSINPYLL